MERTRITPTMARPTIASPPLMKAYSKVVMKAAPIAGPNQLRAPPNTLISTT
jgi:hypothetical protein